MYTRSLNTCKYLLPVNYKSYYNYDYLWRLLTAAGSYCTYTCAKLKQLNIQCTMSYYTCCCRRQRLLHRLRIERISIGTPSLTISTRLMNGVLRKKWISENEIYTLYIVLILWIVEQKKNLWCGLNICNGSCCCARFCMSFLTAIISWQFPVL